MSDASVATLGINLLLQGEDTVTTGLNKIGASGEASAKRVETAFKSTGESAQRAIQQQANAATSNGANAARALGGVGAAAAQSEREVLSLTGAVRAGADAIGASARSIGTDLLHLGAGFVAAFAGLQGIEKFIAETSEAQYVTAQLEAVVKSTGGAAERTVGQMQALAESIQDTSTFSDEAVGRAEALIATFTKIKGDQFDETTHAAADLATALREDVSSAALQLGKALQDPEQGLTALRRSGVSFSGSQQAVIKDLVDTGESAKALDLILKEVEKEFGGSAEKARGTLGGALQGLKNDFGNLFEADKGGTSGLVSGLNGIDKALQAIRPHMGEVLTAVEAVAAAFALREAQFGIAALTNITRGFVVARAETLAYAEANVRAAQTQLIVAEADEAAAIQAAALARANATVAVSMTERIAATEAVATANAAVAASGEAVVVAEAGVATAIAATSVAARAGAAAMGLFEGALALVGGPVGLGVIAVLGAVTYAHKKQSDAVQQAKDDTDRYRDALSKLPGDELRAQQAANETALAQTKARRAALEQQIDANKPAFGTASGYGAAADPTAGLKVQLGQVTAAETFFANAVAFTSDRLKQNGQDIDTLRGKAKQMKDERQAELDKLSAINGAYGQSGLAIKELENHYTALTQKIKDTAAIKELHLDPPDAQRAKQDLDDITDKIEHAQNVAAKNAVLTTRLIDVAQYTAANAALVQAAANEGALADATAKATAANQADANAVTHLRDQLASHLATSANVITSTQAVVAADIAATDAARNRGTAIDHLKTQQEASVALAAAETVRKAESFQADADGIKAAQAKYDATARAIQQAKQLKDADIDRANAAQKVADATARAAADTSFRDAISGQVTEIDRQTAALIEETEAHQKGQSALEALAIRRAEDAALIALESDAAKRGVSVKQDEIDAVLRSVDAREKAAIALSHVTTEEKAAEQIGKNFIKSVQSDVGSFFSDLFSSGGNAAEKFWKSFKDLAIKALGEIASLKFFETLGASASRGGVLGSFATALHLGGAASLPSNVPRSTSAPTAIETRADGTPLAAGSGAQTVAGPSFTDIIQPFALAGAAAIGVATALNKLTGAANSTAESLDKQIQTALGLLKNLDAYRLQVTGSPLAQSIAQNASQADALRQQANDAYPGKRLQDEREKQLAAINALEAERNRQLKEEFAIKQRETTEDYNARLLRAQGANAAADAEAFAYAQQREYAAALKEFGAGEVTTALAAVQEAERKKHDADLIEANKRTVEDLGVRSLVAGGASDRAVDDQRFALAQERELADLRKTGSQEAIDDLIALQELEKQKRAADFALVNAQAQEDYRVRALQAQGHTAEAEALRLQLAQQREYQDAVKAGLDDATLAALALAQAAEGAAAAAKQAQDAQRALDDLQVRALTAQGNTQGADDLRFQLQQQRELEDAKNSGKSQDYIDKLTSVLALEAQSRTQAANATAAGSGVGAAAQRSAQTEAVTYAAKSLTEVTGNRMADYLASILIVEKEIRDAVKGRVPGTINNVATPISIPTAPQTESARTPVSRTTTITIAPVLTFNIDKADDLIDASGRIKAEFIDSITEQLAPAIDQQLHDLIADAQIRSGSNLVTGA